MFNRVTVDYITESADKSRFSIYLVERKQKEESDQEFLLRVQDRIYNAVDVVLDGILASDYPDSKGKDIEIRVVAKDRLPSADLEGLVIRLDEVIQEAPDYSTEHSSFARSLRIQYFEEVPESRDR